jgi:hypothetical protein
MQVCTPGLGIGFALRKFNRWFAAVSSRKNELVSTSAVESQGGLHDEG